MVSECPRCGEKFSGLGLFDKHQDVDYGRRPAVRCMDPGSLGMVRGHTGTWTTPEGLKKLTRVAAMGKSRRRDHRVSSK